MNKSTYEVNGICNRCSDYTLIDVETRVCEGCSESELTFTEAIGKYEAITRDGGTTVYSKNSEGNIIRKTNGIGGGFQLNYGLLISTGWIEHQEQKLIVPERVDYSKQYSYIESDGGKIYTDSDCRFGEDADRLKTFNYFTDKVLAQYIADKQLIQRVELVLHELNFERFGKADRCELINEYIRDNYEGVLHRIKDYEMKNVEKLANRTTK